MPRAVRAAAAIKSALGLEATLQPGGSGVFTISVDGKVVSQRSRAGFPTEEEIVGAVATVLRPTSG